MNSSDGEGQGGALLWSEPAGRSNIAALSESFPKDGQKHVWTRESDGGVEVSERELNRPALSKALNFRGKRVMSITWPRSGAAEIVCLAILRFLSCNDVSEAKNGFDLNALKL